MLVNKDDNERSHCNKAITFGKYLEIFGGVSRGGGG
jgi:hypothetical protein